MRIVVHDEQGNVLPFRGYLQAKGGASYFPPGTARFDKSSTYDERHFLAPGEVTCEVPPGVYVLRVERGLEWLPATREIEVTDQSITVNMLMHRWVDMKALGWYSGDTHIHRAPDEAAVSLLAEDINLGANQTLWNERNVYADRGEPLPPLAYQTLDALHVLNVRSQETERLGKGWGAALFLGDFDPLSLPRNFNYPLTAKVCAEARKRGAHIDFEKSVWRDVPVCAALGLVDSIGVVHNHFHPQAFLPMRGISQSIVPPPNLEMTPRECALYTLDLYYHLLNCGLRMAVSGGSASGVMPSWLGYERTYVKLDEPFTPDAWLRALRAGRSFATNGPVLFLTVDGKDPGAVIELPAARTTLTVKAEARSRDGKLILLELLHNGEVVAKAERAEGTNKLYINQELELGPGWLAARCFEPEGDTQVYAATSPVYLEHEGQRGEVPDSARYYAEVVRQMIEQSLAEKRFTAPEQESEALQILDAALRYYQHAGGE
ncbi:MAG: CehA/McbA family metallohydrolase [Candidatus Hydrogenedentes bacterium]|nr:CehA/McbA family metallohydrolase [Candidatus Hydrogenedentota bacterium]